MVQRTVRVTSSHSKRDSDRENQAQEPLRFLRSKHYGNRSLDLIRRITQHRLSIKPPMAEKQGRSWEKCRPAELNCGHTDFQSVALPAELGRHWRPRLVSRGHFRRS